jgi:valyl-tRNA synthetase
MQPYFESMAGAVAVAFGPDVRGPASSAHVNLPGIEVFVDVKDFIDVEAEITRKAKEEEKLVVMIANKEKKLANPQFVGRAPAEVIERERSRLSQLREQLRSIQTTLGDLRGQR